MLFKIVLIYNSGGPFVQRNQTICAILEEGLLRNQLLRRCCLKTFYVGLWWPICLVEQNHLCNSGRKYHEEQFCETILHSGGDVV